MGKVNIPPLKISFCKSTSKKYERALQIIESHRSYYLDEGNEKTVVIPPVHMAEYNLLDTKDRAEALELGLLCAKWVSASITMGQFIIMRSVLYSADFCASMYTGEGYCFGRSSPTASDVYIWGCQRLGDHCNGIEGTWYDYGHLDEDEVFILHKEDVWVNLLEAAMRTGAFLCPYFNFDTVSEVLNNLPGEIDPQADTRWDYLWANQKGKRQKVGVMPSGWWKAQGGCQ